MKMTTTYDEKIMNFDIANGYEAFVKMFEDDEISDMRDWLEREFDMDFSWISEKELAECVAIEYVKEWLVQNIRNMTYSGTEQLFSIIYKM